MTFSVAQFRERANENKTGYFVPDTSGRGYRVATLHEWKDREPRWQRSASNRARLAFVESLAREFGREIAHELQKFLPAQGTPLSSRTVGEIIEFGKIRQAETAHKQEIDGPVLDLDGNIHFTPPARREQVRRLPPGELEELNADDELDPSDKGKEPEDPRPQNKTPQWTSPRPNAPRPSQPASSFQRGLAPPPPREPESPARRQYRSAKELERAEVALYKSFKAIERHARNGTTRLALGDHDKALAELLSKAKRPDCKSLDERIFKSTGERTSLAIHWDLPKTMKNWVELILNATSKGDAAQIELEMRLHLEQLDKDIALLEKTLPRKPLPARLVLNPALRQLKSMREQLKSSESWARLETHLQAMRHELPPEPLRIVDADLAEEKLEKLGISRKAGEDPVDLANEMVRAYNLLRDARLRDPNSSWAAVYQAANPQHRKILDKYRSRLLDHIEDVVDRRSEGKAQIKFDRTAKKTYSIVTKDVGHRLQASGQLRTIAWQIGGAADLQQALGFEEDPSTG
jgi:hypothetical protein